MFFVPDSEVELAYGAVSSILVPLCLFQPSRVEMATTPVSLSLIVTDRVPAPIDIATGSDLADVFHFSGHARLGSEQSDVGTDIADTIAGLEITRQSQRRNTIAPNSYEQTASATEGQEDHVVAAEEGKID